MLIRSTVPGDKTDPEGTARQHATPCFCAGSTTDGTICRGDVHQSGTTVFVPGSEDGRTSMAGMKTDRAGRLIVASGATGKVFVYNTRTRAQLHVFATGRTDAFLNDTALVPNGDACILQVDVDLNSTPTTTTPASTTTDWSSPTDRRAPGPRPPGPR
ncbi:hypothetical protein ACFWIJ_16045 [Streptomyces sp. NPDC127079]|uniref:hypothetical protein n=1 Tax=Streptomyces sp. NPDC127079 TaxID=3347132 RepID=UPI0036628183